MYILCSLLLSYVPQNFKLYSGLKVIQTKKSLTFVGHDNGVSQTYNVRVPDEDRARQLKEAIEREIDLL